jgi:signal transduction histidine kinase
MSIRNKIMGALLLVLSFFAVASLYQYERMKHSNQRLGLVNDLFMPFARQVAQIQSHLQTLSDDMRRFYFSPQAQQENPVLSRMARDLYPFVIQKKLAKAAELLAAHQDKEAGAEDLINRIRRIQSQFDEFMKSSDKTAFEKSLEDIRGGLMALSKRAEDECQTITRSVQKEAKESLITSFFLAAAVLLLGGAALGLSYRVLNPLPELIARLKKISNGDLDQTIKVDANTQDEISVLAREYNRMLSALKERDKQIQHQQKELVKSERLAAVGELSAEVVHVFLNPLNSISLIIDWLENELKTATQDVKETLSAVSKEIGRLNEITERHLVRARVGVENTKMTPVHELINEIVSFDKGANDRIEIKTELWPEELFVRGDRTRLKQAFVNVVKNAKEAMPRGGVLEVRTELKNNTARIMFKDSGCGMSSSVRKKSFTPFFTTKSQGTGIGLSLTKQVVEELNGAIECESEVGKGTSFLFQFPV